jgi:hypothetical protein
VRCEEARRSLSLAADDAAPADWHSEVDDHVAGCAQCQSFRRHLETVRHELRFEVVREVPDLTGRVLAAARAPSPPTSWRPRLVPAVAAAVVGALVGASIVSGTRPGDPPTPVAAAIPERVARAQVRLESLSASVRIIERGWHPRVPERTFAGELVYRAPESVSLRLQDHTKYPTGPWKPNDTAFVVDGGRLWTSGPAGCPVEAQPECTPTQARVQVIGGREPFAPDAPAPLDLVLPAGAFAVGRTAPVVPGDASVDGRPAVRVLATVAQVDPLLAGLRRAGNWRELHPSDPVELWLDRDALVPLRAVVRAGSGRERQRWAAVRGYRDDGGAVLLEFELRGVVLNQSVGDSAFPAPPAAPVVRDLGFREGPVAGPSPARVPAGLQPHVSGVIGASGAHPVTVRSWSDGRAWLTMRSTTAWMGGRLFGDLGDVVRQVRDPNGVLYLSEAGDAVALHGDGVDLVVSGTVGVVELLATARSTGVRGLPVPEGWAEAPGSISDAAARLPGLLVPHSAGFAPPAVRVTDAVTMFVAGPGARGFVLVQTPGDRLAPPFDADVVAVRVRGHAGRYTADRGQLEWVEGGRVIELRSTTLPLGELLAVARALQAARS